MTAGRILLAFFLFCFAPTKIFSHEVCENFIQIQERVFGIPSHLLHAISLIESGKMDLFSKKHRPWPWTVHVNGKGYYFKSKHEAIKAVEKFMHK